MFSHGMLEAPTTNDVPDVAEHNQACLDSGVAACRWCNAEPGTKVNEVALQNGLCWQWMSLKIGADKVCKVSAL